MSPAAAPGVIGSSTFKPRDVEELIDFYLHRRAANLVVRLLAPTRITPDQVTIASGITGIVAGGIIGTASAPWQVVLGAFAFFSAVVLDCSDGQLARLRGTSSFAGRALDGYVDAFSVGSIFVGQFAYLVRHGSPFWMTFVLGWIAGAAFNWHVNRYDHFKNLYLLNTESPEKGEDAYPSLEAIEAERQQHMQAGRHFRAFLLKSFTNYTISQRAAETRRGSERRATTDAERALYRSVFAGYMRAWTFNGVGTHLFVMTAATVVATWFPTAPFLIWLFIIGPWTFFMLMLFARRGALEARYEQRRVEAASCPSPLR